MLGAIIGDVAGSTYEFHNTKDYNCELFPEDSNYTDDSIMTVAVASWLLKDPSLSRETLVKEMVRFGKAFPCPMGGYGGGFQQWLSTKGERKPYGSWGNGSAMRVSAVGWFFETLEETENAAMISAVVTHNHPEGIKGAKATAAAIFLARNGATKEEIREYIESNYGYDLHKTWEYWHPIYKWESGCQGTVPQAMIAFLDSDSFEDAIRKAVSLGGDSDTLACITGGIAEAYYKDIPQWIADRVLPLLPKRFLKVIDAVRDTN